MRHPLVKKIVWFRRQRLELSAQFEELTCPTIEKILSSCYPPKFAYAIPLQKLIKIRRLLFSYPCWQSKDGTSFGVRGDESFSIPEQSRACFIIATEWETGNCATSYMFKFNVHKKAIGIWIVMNLVRADRCFSMGIPPRLIRPRCKKNWIYIPRLRLQNL